MKEVYAMETITTDKSTRGWKEAEEWAVDKKNPEQCKISFLKKEIYPQSYDLWRKVQSPHRDFWHSWEEAMVAMMHVCLFKCTLGIKERIRRVTSASEFMLSFIYIYVPFPAVCHVNLNFFRWEGRGSPLSSRFCWRLEGQWGRLTLHIT